MPTLIEKPEANCTPRHWTHAAIAEVLGVSTSRVQQIEARALEKIRLSIERRAKREKKTIGQWIAGE